MLSDLTLSPSFYIERGRPNLKVLITRLLLILEVCNVKPTHRKSWAGNLLMWLDLTFGSSFKFKRWFTGFGELSFRWIQICICSPMHRSSFGLVLKTKWLPYYIFYVKWGGGGGAYQKALTSPLSLVLEVWNEKTIYWKSLAGNILQVSNLTFDPCFRVM